MSNNTSNVNGTAKYMAVVFAFFIVAAVLGVNVGGYAAFLAIVSFIVGSLCTMVSAPQAAAQAFGAFAGFLALALFWPIIAHILHSGFGLLLLAVIVAVACIAGYARFKDGRHRFEQWVGGEKNTSNKKRVEPDR